MNIDPQQPDYVSSWTIIARFTFIAFIVGAAVITHNVHKDLEAERKTSHGYSNSIAQLTVHANQLFTAKDQWTTALLSYMSAFATNPRVSEIAFSREIAWTFSTNVPHSSNYTTIVTPTNIIMRKEPIDNQQTSSP